MVSAYDEAMQRLPEASWLRALAPALGFVRSGHASDGRAAAAPPSPGVEMPSILALTRSRVSWSRKAPSMTPPAISTPVTPHLALRGTLRG